jgi:DNA-binding NarL/FixJ family response regulator
MSTDPIRVVIADAHEAVRAETLSLIKRDRRLDVAGEAASGQQAIDLVARLKPDVLVLDLRLPDIPGMEVARRIARDYPGTRILALSSYDDEDYVVAALDAGVAGYLPKTAGADEVLNAIHSIVEGDVVLRTAVASRLLRRAVSTRTSRGEGERLTDRELEILELVARGLRNRQIAEELHLSSRTVEAHLAHAFTKLKVATRTQALLQAAARGLLVIPMVL